MAFLDIPFNRQPVISDEGKERLLPQEELTCVEDMIVADGESNTITTSGHKRPLVELSEADSTVSNGFEDSGAMHQEDKLSILLPKKQRCKDSDEESNSTSDASSTTSAHETVSLTMSIVPCKFNNP